MVILLQIGEGILPVIGLIERDTLARICPVGIQMHGCGRPLGADPLLLDRYGHLARNRVGDDKAVRGIACHRRRVPGNRRLPDRIDDFASIRLVLGQVLELALPVARRIQGQ